MHVRKLSVILQVILWLSAFILTLIWIFWPNPPFEPEPLTVAIGLIASGVSAVLKKYKNKLREEEFSTANALAVGYVNNFIEPILTQLIKEKESPKFVVYIPKKLSDLLPKNIDRLISNLKELNLNSETISVSLNEGRGARDIMTVFNHDGANIYFDFPNTLLTLVTLIDYKVKTKRNSFNTLEKNELGKIYISKFKDTVEKLLTYKNLFPKYVIFISDITEINL